MTTINRRRLLQGSAAATLVAGSGLPALAAGGRLKVGVIHMGAISDTGWEHYQAEGWRALEAEFPDQVELTVLENIAQMQDNERLFRQLSTTGHQLIFGTSFSQYASMRKLAPTLTGSHFECCAGIEAGPNLGIFEAKHHEGTYLTGIAAGRMTQSNVLGWVGAFPVPQVISSLNAFLLGARSVNPDATLRVVWANAWVDPGRERDAVAALVAQGADVISGSPNTPVQGLTAEELGVWSVGSTGDFSAYVKKAQLVSFELNWSAAHIEAAGAVLRGEWEPTNRWRGLGGGGFVKMTTASPELPADVATGMAAAESVIVAGDLNPYAGPLRDQDGTERVAAGAVLPDNEIKSMTWLIEGVQGQLPSG